jgi:hypothetical protein
LEKHTVSCKVELILRDTGHILIISATFSALHILFQNFISNFGNERRRKTKRNFLLYLNKFTSFTLYKDVIYSMANKYSHLFIYILVTLKLECGQAPQGKCTNILSSTSCYGYYETESFHRLAANVCSHFVALALRNYDDRLHYSTK